MKYRKRILAVLLLAAFAARGEDEPEVVVQQFIDHTVAGRTNEAASCYAISTEAQRRQVEARLQKYMPAVMAGEEQLQPLRSFVEGACAVTAILVKRKASPGDVQVERCYMIRGPNGWKLLPTSDSFRSRSNALAPEQIAVFEKLAPVVDAYRQEERLNRMKKESEPATPPYSEPASRSPQR